MLRAAAILAVLLATTSSLAQQSFHPRTVVDPEEGVPGYKRKYLPPEGYVSPDDRRIAAISRATIEEAKRVMPPGLVTVPEHIVITYGAGGLLYEHNMRFAGYRNAGFEVEMRGPCFSACTLITAYVAKDKLCFASGAFLAFHAARSPKHEIRPAETALMYWQQPVDIRNWIDRAGGHENLPLDGFWTMSDRELWAIGYPRCK